MERAFDSPESERRKSMCPECSECRATPKSVSVGNRTRTITYECPTCHRRWDVQSEISDKEFV